MKISKTPHFPQNGSMKLAAPSVSVQLFRVTWDAPPPAPPAPCLLAAELPFNVQLFNVPLAAPPPYNGAALLTTVQSINVPE
jgi:hypothetical protein